MKRGQGSAAVPAVARKAQEMMGNLQKSRKRKEFLPYYAKCIIYIYIYIYL